MCVCVWGGGVVARLPENSPDNVSCSPQPIKKSNRGCPMVYQWFISEKTINFQGFREGPAFSRGRGSSFSRGKVQMLISIDTRITCDFLGGRGGSDPYPPSGFAHDRILYH